MDTLFRDIKELRRYAQGVDGTISLDTLAPAFSLAKKAVIDTIGAEVCEALPKTEADSTGKALRFAIANYAMYKHLIFLSTSKNNSDQRLYKYQYEEIKEEYVAQFWAAMDSLLEWLDANPETGKYKDGKLCKERAELLVRSGHEFDYYYGIERSEYFYSKILFLIRQVQQNDILPRVGKISDISTNTDLMDKVKRTLCYHVMAEAVMKFDLTELPRSVRWDLTHEFTKEGSQMQVREKLYGNLMKTVNTWYGEIETSISLSKGAKDKIMSNNSENNKYFGML